MLRGRRRPRKREPATRSESLYPPAAFARDLGFALRAAAAGFALTGFGFGVFSTELGSFAAATALLASSFAAGSVDLSAASLDPAAACSTRLRFVSPLFLKSVSYQPLPFKRNC